MWPCGRHCREVALGHWICIPKGSGGTRKIYVPDPLEKLHLRARLPELRALWKRAARKARVLSVVHGFVPGRSAVTAAAAHIGCAVALSVDLEDFFGQVTLQAVSYALLGYGCSPPPWLEELFRDGIAAQGLPTSPVAANIAALPLDCKLSELAREHGLVYTRYADDITLSSPDPATRMADLLPRVRQAVEASGFRINPRKVRVQTSRAGRIVICGIGVGPDTLHPTRKALRKLRALRHMGKHTAARGLEAWCRLTLPRHTALSVLVRAARQCSLGELCHVKKSPCGPGCTGAWQAQTQVRRSCDAYTALLILQAAGAVWGLKGWCPGRCIQAFLAVSRALGLGALRECHASAMNSLQVLDGKRLELLRNAVEAVDPHSLYTVLRGLP